MKTEQQAQSGRDRTKGEPSSNSLRGKDSTSTLVWGDLGVGASRKGDRAPTEFATQHCIVYFLSGNIQDCRVYFL